MNEVNDGYITKYQNLEQKYMSNPDDWNVARIEEEMYRID